MKKLISILFTFLLVAVISAIAAPTRSSVASFQTAFIPAGGGYEPLPDDLVAIEYLQSSGTQWIDTGVNLQPGLECDFSLSFPSVTYGAHPFGARQTSPRSWFDMLWRFHSSQVLYYGTGSMNPSYPSKADMNTTTIYDGSIRETSITIGGRTTTHGGTIVDADETVYLFCYNLDGTPDSFATIRIYNFSLSKQGAMLVYFVPVRFLNESDQWEGAMFDMVSRQLFRNQGSGAFIIGPDL